MAMSVGGPRKGAIAEINVTPMADVMIVLLIIFMVTMPLFTNPVRLPRAASAIEHRGERLEIVVRASGLVSVGEETLANADMLAEFLTAKPIRSGHTVLIQADRGVAYAEVAKVLAACREAGAPEVALAAQRPVGS